MKKLFVLLFFAIITIHSFAQHNYQDVVYLKNGSIIRGFIIEQVPNKSIKIETADRSVFVFELDEIEKFTKEPFKGRRTRSNDNPGMKVGYKGTVETGFQLGVGDWGADRLKLNVINGFQLTPHFSMGLGTGLRFYYDLDAALVPLFLDFRVNFLDRKVSPYFALGAGYSFNASDNFEAAGVLINPSAGVSFKVSGKSSMNIGLGYEVQQMDFFINAYDYHNNYVFSYSKNAGSGALSLTVGFSY
ncbi:MAG TPA: hypothetical protein VFG54_15240 [Prolixibacteraceae bacterium]|nr:hypothetical protein [Prolixibacteraceae bacterium]